MVSYEEHKVYAQPTNQSWSLPFSFLYLSSTLQYKSFRLVMKEMREPGCHPKGES